MKMRRRPPRDNPHRPRTRPRHDWRQDLAANGSLILRVFLPFVAGYYLAYLFRTINAVMASPLATELGLSAGDLGLLTSVYFLTFAAAQIPDRHPAWTDTGQGACKAY